MKLNRLPELQRREFLRRASALGLAGAAAPLAFNLAALGEAAAATAPGDYKALVCVFLYGGNDYGNTLVPYDQPSYDAYAAIRLALATPRDQLAATALGLSVGSRQMALAPQLGKLKSLWDSGRLGVQLNVGTLVQPTTLAQYKAQSVPLPPKLFSHNDQQSVWQSSSPEGATTGWGGRMGDLFLSGNGTSTFTCINASGNAVFMAGRQAVQYQVSTSGAVPINGIMKPLYGSQACADALRGLITAGDRSHWMEAELNRVVTRSVSAQSVVTAGLAGVPALTTAFDTTSSLSNQLLMVAKLIAARQALGATRQVFFVSLGGFDLHDFLVAQHPGLLTAVDDALASFYAATVELGVASQVTTFTASDFGRTLTSNGDGSDHGWGSHHFVLGGAVQGGRFWGSLPSVSINGPDDVGQGRLLPTTAVDQLGATLATWMGVSATDLASVMPQIVNYSQRDMAYF
ncbi:DUF1501 domain-containing protein [Roseateles saccharophilus]|uniref:Uncharacterized protein (DUF1501 family) n=1 Tax=Roseateles saccharophilus TaxID=304 RepID=A0A4V2VSS1_ROSSA|nr:DUF1501 domain-containing protein [Roseateles saccharophilus]MDG0834795.1 DUF1501 domain-containing protein [Roseateles saccharophilus]TCV03390.1 uncharacterized protein (DUF1501 family) [Roseateles saccharophilus]